MKRQLIVVSLVFTALVGCEREPRVVNLGTDAEPAEMVSEAVMQCQAEETCPACITCARDGPCYSFRIACTQIPDCGDLLACHEGCDLDNPECIGTCEAQYPGGREPLETWLGCIVCEVCDPRCDSTACD
jgi:hypothetical protein